MLFFNPSTSFCKELILLFKSLSVLAINSSSFKYYSVNKYFEVSDIIFRFTLLNAVFNLLVI
nr:MAG TPA: hypothetical protein [Caudoviricetes sp.]